MKYLITFVLLAILAFVAWPYITVYRLDRAVAANDKEALSHLVDLEALRNEIKRNMDKDVTRVIGSRPGPVSTWLQDGFRRFSGQAVDTAVDLEWVRHELFHRERDPENPHATLVGDISYAFFESYNRFLVRVGELGNNPVHLRMTLDSGRWRVTGIYD